LTSFRNSVAVIASPRPRVGKTLLARLLVDFYLHEGAPSQLSISMSAKAR